MSRRLLLINVMLGLLCLTFATGIVRSLFVKRPLPAAAATRTVVSPRPAVTPTPTLPGPDIYASIATQNLFNPGRSETATVAVATVVKPILHGIVIEGSRSRAFLEDPSVKRVGRYSVGDPVAGGTLQKIADDRVLIARPAGVVEVLLQDPAKPRPAPAASAVPPVVAGAPSPPVPGQQESPSAPGQVAPVQGAPRQVVPPPGGGAPVPAAVAQEQNQGLGQVIPSAAPGTQPSAVPLQIQRRAAGAGATRQ